MHSTIRRTRPVRARSGALLAALLASISGLFACDGGGGGGGSAAAIFATPTRSSSLALTSDDRALVVVNRETDSVAVLRVRDAAGADLFAKLDEVPVGQDPRSVALTPDDARAFVTNAASGTVSVIELDAPVRVIAEIPVGTEPRGIAATPSGARFFVANHTAGTVSVIDADSLQVIDTVTVGGNPSALAVSNDGDADDLDETVFVTQFFAEPIPGGPGEGFDEGRRGVLHAFPVSGASAPAAITLSPLADVGFTADRAPFCAEFNAAAHSEIFCPDTAATDPLDPAIAQDPQGAFPNQLQALVLRDGLLYVPSIGAGPEPPVRFNVNVQGLVHVVDGAGASEIAERTVNLNAQIRTEPAPAVPNQSLGKLFANDVVAIDADPLGDVFLIVSRGGNYVLRAALDANGKLDIGAPNAVVRFQTGNIPNGVAISADGLRAYVNNEVGVSVTAIDLANDVVLERDVATGTLPVPGSFEHSALLGKLVFHTALGTPDLGLFGTSVRDIVPLESRGKASDNAWSSCSSCHPDGLSDNVTWIFGTGPRQTVPLDAFFSKQSPLDQRISNWSAVMGSVTDFNNNAIGVQGGTGFAGQPPPATIFQHGITEGGSDSLDAMTLWVQTIRPLEQPDSTDLPSLANGEVLFQANCASCHGGAKWTKSQIVYDNNPTFDEDPNGVGVPFDPGVLNAKAQIRSFTQAALTLAFLEDVGTFDPLDPFEIRGQAATQGQIALGALGFNVPSLLSIRYHAPYLHDGSAPTLEQAFQVHGLDGGTIESSFSAQELADLAEFLNAIDGSTRTIPSDADVFLQTVRGR